VTYHSRSIVGFGQLLNTLTKGLTDGLPVSTALDVIQEQFAAEAVVLGITSRGGNCLLIANERCDAFAATRDSCEQSAALAAMLKQYQHVAANEHGRDNSVEYSLWIFRDREASRFDNEETALAGILVAQIARALDLVSRIENGSAEMTLYSDALDRLNVGVIIVDEHGKVSSSSAVAERLLQARDGLQIQAGKLRAINTSEDRNLQAAIRETAMRNVGDAGPGISRGLSLTKPCGARSLGIVVRPVNTRASGPSAVAIYLRDCDAVQDVESEFVRQIFDLTPAEAAVTHRLTTGLSLEDAAASLDISRNTARAHLRSIFSKSGISRQTELVRLVLNSAVILGHSPQQAA